MNRAVVRASMEARLVVGYGDVARLDLTLRYSVHDQFAVRAEFRTDEAATVWIFSRDVLKAGLAQASGVGDVHVWPVSSRSAVMVALTSHEGSATIELDSADVELFLASTEELVPFGAEAVNVDWITAQIFSSAQP